MGKQDKYLEDVFKILAGVVPSKDTRVEHSIGKREAIALGHGLAAGLLAEARRDGDTSTDAEEFAIDLYSRTLDVYPECRDDLLRKMDPDKEPKRSKSDRFKMLSVAGFLHDSRISKEVAKLYGMPKKVADAIIFGIEYGIVFTEMGLDGVNDIEALSQAVIEGALGEYYEHLDMTPERILDVD